MLGPMQEWSPDLHVCVCRHTPEVFDQGWLQVSPAWQMCDRYHASMSTAHCVHVASRTHCLWQVYMYTPLPSHQCLSPADVTGDGIKEGGALSPVWVTANP